MRIIWNLFYVLLILHNVPSRSLLLHCCSCSCGCCCLRIYRCSWFCDASVSVGKYKQGMVTSSVHRHFMTHLCLFLPRSDSLSRSLSLTRAQQLTAKVKVEREGKKTKAKPKTFSQFGNLIVSSLDLNMLHPCQSPAAPKELSRCAKEAKPSC